MSPLPDLGPYAPYIWGSYLAAAILLGGMVLSSLRSAKNAKKTLERLRAKTKDQP